MIHEPKWRSEGEDPDYRYSLANERTFLAWIRTSMAILAGAIAINQLAPEIGPAPVRNTICVLLALAGAAVALESYHRWRAQEQAMRQNQPLPHSWLLITLTVILTIAAAVFSVIFLTQS